MMDAENGANIVQLSTAMLHRSMLVSIADYLDPEPCRAQQEVNVASHVSPFTLVKLVTQRRSNYMIEFGPSYCSNFSALSF